MTPRTRTPDRKRRDRVRRTLELPLVYLADLSRDGRTAAILSNHVGSLQLFALPLRKGARPRRLSHGEDRVVFAEISHGGRDVAFSRDFGGREDYQLFRVPLRGGRERQVAPLPPTRIFDFCWSRDDELIAFSGANRDFNGVWFVDPETGAFRDVYRAKHWTFSPTFSADDQVVCFASKTTEAATAAELLFLDREGRGPPTLYTPKEGSENSGPAWHPKERSVVFKTDARGRYDLAVHDLSGRKLRYLQAGDLGLGRDFSSFDWTPDGDRIYYLAMKEGRTRLYIEPLDSSEAPVAVPLPEGVHGPLEMDRSGAFVVFSWSSLSRPMAVARYDLAAGRTTPVLERATRLPLGRAEHVVYRTFDGLPIHGWFLKPPRHRGRKTALLWIHGGPAWEVADEWNPAIQALVVAGYPLFAPNIRGSTGYGAEFEHLNIHDLGGGDLKDVAAASKYMRRRPEVDPAKIAIVGASYGGYMTFLAMTKLPKLWAAGAAIVGITDWEESYELSDAAFRSFIERYFGPPDANRELYRDRSPIHFVGDIRAPLLIWHRGNDSRCPLIPVEKFADRLKELGKPYEMVVVWDEGHGMQKTENLVRQYEGVAAFLDKTVRARP